MGSWLDLRSPLKANYIKIKENSIFENNGKTFIYADNILAEVIKSKGSVYHIVICGKNKESFLVTDGKNFSHGETLQEAKEDLVYKITDRKKDDYKNHNLETVLNFEESVKCYRTITGACSLGTKNFVTSVLSERKNNTLLKRLSTLQKVNMVLNHLETSFMHSTKIKELRVSQGLTRKPLATISGVHWRTICEVEKRC